jgi:hypothetical protein
MVTIAFDEEAQRWSARNDDIPIILEDCSAAVCHLLDKH